MSRSKRLKEKKRKQLIKTTMSGLALTLAIGSSQTMTTYAWFTDRESIENDLAINMGEIDVNTTDGFNVKGLDNGNSIEKQFDIVNSGTLKQHLTLSLEGINNDILKYINYNIKFNEYDGKEIKSISTQELISGDVSLRYEEDGSLVILQSKDTINATAYIRIDEDMTKGIISSFVDEPLKFNLNVKANQVNNEDTILNWGFSDIATQNSFLQFNKIIDPEVPSEPELVEPPKEEVNIPSDPEVTEPPKEEVEVPSEPEVTEPPKEEVEVPSEPEVTEPPKEEVEVPSEPEVTEPPKEEIEVPSEPEVIEPPKEEVDIPSEPEVIEPPKEETIEIQKQPEVIEIQKENECIQ